MTSFKQLEYNKAFDVYLKKKKIHLVNDCSLQYAILKYIIKYILVLIRPPEGH